MMPLGTAFVGLVVLFGIIGALRGWAKELLVTFAVILGRFIELVILNYMFLVSAIIKNMADNDPKGWFYMRTLLFILMISFGYATTAISAALGGKARKEKLQDTLLGFFLGAINGVLIAGLLWAFLDQEGYTLWGITAPVDNAWIGVVQSLLNDWLVGAPLFIAVALAFAFVLVVFV
ncbi:MAG: hypothetical protein U9R05_08585 [Chloroflexota bacterium]|nr:hypothetical protein [Chloroflexota bacterium]